MITTNGIKIHIKREKTHKWEDTPTQNIVETPEELDEEDLKDDKAIKVYNEVLGDSFKIIDDIMGGADNETDV